MSIDSDKTRRSFLTGATFVGSGLVLSAQYAKADDKKEEVAPNEDLMREHGLLKRILLIYDEGIRRLDADQDLSPASLADSAKIIREFVEDYHEKLEEDFLFPRMRKANKLVELVDVLQQQHQAGRVVTNITLRLANLQSMKNAADRKTLRTSLAQFIRMYNPHEAREDTILFPAFKSVISKNEYASLGEAFEKKEHQLFGEDGFEKMVDKVAVIEKSLGIYDLAQFTPTLK